MGIVNWLSQWPVGQLLICTKIIKLNLKWKKSQWPVGQLLICTLKLALRNKGLGLSDLSVNCSFVPMNSYWLWKNIRLSDLSEGLRIKFPSGVQMLCKVLQSSFIIEWCWSLDYRLPAIPFSHLSDLSVNCSFVHKFRNSKFCVRRLSDLSVNCSFVL